MRLRRLELTRYGRFTDGALDFGVADGGRPDLHIVYGPNEAGKSTTIAAFLDLLYGIEQRSPYGFLHPYATMRIGAALDVGGTTRDFVRIKRSQNSLLDGREEVVPEGVILDDLAGIGRDAYRTMFSLDDETLEKGGKAILDSKGDLGQLLFSASAGLADLGHGLAEARAGADRFHRPSARSGELAELRRELDALKRRRAEIDVVASDYARLVASRDLAWTQYQDALAARGEVQARRDEVSRHLNALPRLKSLRDVKERLAAYAGLPEPPPHWRDEIAALQQEAVELDVKEKATAEDVARLAVALEAIAVDEPALRLAGRMTDAAELRARHMTADKDLPDRRLRLREAEGEIAALLRHLDRAGDKAPERLVVASSVVGRLRKLIEARSGIEAALRAAADELAGARGRLDEAEAKLVAAGGVPGEAARQARSSLAATLAALRQEDFRTRRRLAERAEAAAKASLDDGLRQLQPWRGTPDELAGLRCPDAEALRQWRAALAEAQARLDRATDDAERMRTEVRRLEVEREARRATADVASDGEAAEVRTERERAWAEHRERLDPASAERFEAALRRDDGVSAGRFARVADVEALRRLDQALRIESAGAQHAIERRDAAKAALLALERRIGDAVAAVSPTLRRMTLDDVETWLARRKAALETRGRIREAQRDVAEADTDGEEGRRRLRAALACAGGPASTEASFDDLMVEAEAAVEREARLAGLWTAAEDRRRDAEMRQRDAARAETDDARWVKAWAETCAACWLGENGAAPSTEAVGEILAVLAKLDPALARRDGLADRVDKMEKDQAGFASLLEALAAGIGLEAAGESPLALAREIDARIAGAVAASTQREDAARELAAARERDRALSLALAVHRQRVAAMTEFFDVATLADAVRKLADAEKRDDLARQVHEGERGLLDTLRLTDLEEVERRLAEGDRAALEAELALLDARFEAEDQRCRDLFAGHAKAEEGVRAVGADAEAAAIEEKRRTVLLAIEEGAWRYLRMRAGIAAAERGLRAYRDSHRSSMMARASEAFRTISRGAYSGLAAQPGKEGDILVAMKAGGGSREAGELSKGTCFQLYLALRVAGYHEFVRARRPVPFVADDIMETFDDFRAEEAFRLFAGMAGAGQVIYLTHHRHLCDIALSVCPAVRVHELAPVA